MTERTLRNWKRLDPAERVAPPGRPRLSGQALAEARELVAAELDQQGWAAGEGPVHRALKGVLPLSRVRRVMKELKAEHRQRRRQHEREARVSMTVKHRDAVWSMDATHLGRSVDGGDVQGEVVREVRSTRSIGLAVGKPATAGDVIGLLDQTALERGGNPLVLLTDNGSAYRSKQIEGWCEKHKVVHLYSLPRTPQHNAASEHGMRELKEDAELGKGAVVTDTEGVRDALVHSRDRIDGCRPRRTRGWMTAVEYDHDSRHWEAVVSREAFWEKASCAIEQAVLDSKNWREERRAARAAVLGTLQHFSVITLTRGGRPWTAHNAEDD